MRPNILYIMTDQQSATAMNCAGNPDLQTPHMDALAARGMRFTNAYCTQPLCTPCRGSMFTGLMPHQSGASRNDAEIAADLRPRELGNLLRNAGYDCGYGGKWHVAQYTMPDPEEHGFRLVSRFGDDVLAANAIAFLGEKREKPFFLVASFDNPHNICEWMRGQTLPWGSVEEKPLDDCPNLPPNFSPPPFESHYLREANRVAIEIFAGGHYTPERWRQYRSAYCRLVERVDGEIGKILAALRELGLEDDTLVVFSSDHGDGEGAHRWNNKQALYEECVRVPLIVAGPGVAQGRIDNRLVSEALDLLPTLCDVAGVKPPADLPGRSLRPLFEGGEPAGWRPYVAIETAVTANSPLGTGGLTGRAIRSERYKYVCYRMGVYREQLFDMESDRGEMVNLAVQASACGILHQHRDYLEEWCDATADGFKIHIPGVRDRELGLADRFPSG